MRRHNSRCVTNNYCFTQSKERGHSLHNISMQINPMQTVCSVVSQDFGMPILIDSVCMYLTSASWVQFCSQLGVKVVMLSSRMASAY